MPDAEPPTLLSADQPWRGREPYTEADRAFFHGRRRETEELRHLLLRDSLTLLTGVAGSGKTSLVRAGLLPSLSPDWLPVPIALDWAGASDQRPLSRQVLEAIEIAAKARGLDVPAPVPTDTLWEAFHRTGARWWNARQRVVTPVLVFDQFENAFVAGDVNATTRRHRDRFLEELSQLAANRPPSRVASRLEDGTEREDAFDFGPAPVRILLVVREESAAKIAALRALFPKLGRSELRLTAFTEAQARDVLIRAGAQRGLFAEGVVDQLLPRLAAGNEREYPFPPATLSTQARELADQRTQRNAPQITADFFAPPAGEAPTLRAIPPAEFAPVATPTKAPRRLARSLWLVAVVTLGVGAWFWQERKNEPLPLAASQTLSVSEEPVVVAPTPQPISTPLPTPVPKPRPTPEPTPVPTPTPTPMPRVETPSSPPVTQPETPPAPQPAAPTPKAAPPVPPPKPPSESEAPAANGPPPPVSTIEGPRPSRASQVSKSSAAQPPPRDESRRPETTQSKREATTKVQPIAPVRPPAAEKKPAPLFKPVGN